ncbi:hypothetical protein [Lewinella sp. LCG006]|uniref:hypothetical protein n=1 Tax=Lewinella sp. LCG006 TaxID=3231911 RepID=UPI003460233E
MHKLLISFVLFTMNIVFGNLIVSQPYELRITEGGREWATEMIYDNGSVFIVGGSDSFIDGLDDHRPYFIKVSQNGDILWDRIIELDTEVIPSAAAQLNSTRYLAAGNTLGSFNRQQHIYIESINSTAGWESWAEVYDDFFGSVNDLIVDEGNIYITGDYWEVDSEYEPRDFLMARFSSSGELIWRIAFGDNDNERGLRLVVVDENHLMGFGIKSNEISGQLETVYYKLNKDGELIWQGLLDYQSSIVCRDVLLGEDGFIYLSGEVYNGYRSLFVAKIDVSGEVIWVNEYGSNSNIYDARLYSQNDRLFLMGDREADTEYQTEIVLFEINYEGIILCEKVVVESELSVIKTLEDFVITEENELFILASVTDVSTTIGYDRVIFIKKDESPDCIVNTFEETGGEYFVKVSTVGSNRLLIQTPEIIDSHIDVYDALGRRIDDANWVLQKGANFVSISLRKGLNIVCISSNNGYMSSHKIINY